MKTKNLSRLGFLMITMLIFILVGCSKSNTTQTTTPGTESMQQLTADENTVTNASDQVMNDAEGVLSQGKDKSTESGPCNTTITVGSVVNDTISIDVNYHGADCDNKVIRSGDVIIKKRYQENWNQAGSTVILLLESFKRTKISNGKSLTLNGKKYFENVSGHSLIQLGLDSTVTSVVHKIWGNITATFDDNTTKVWSIARQETYTGSLINLVITEDGFGSANGYSNLEYWGINRNSEQFYSSITQSVIYRQVCDFNPCSGIIVNEIPLASKSSTTTFGYDSNNNLITNGDCPTRYRVDWVIGNKSGTFFLPL
ncbi:MAG: hypothetical protein ABSD71_10310 [Bacteroidales bacterium]|jgi:PBP1b-binding outer membrane lipoprotein LpoB